MVITVGGNVSSPRGRGRGRGARRVAPRGARQPLQPQQHGAPARPAPPPAAHYHLRELVLPEGRDVSSVRRFSLMRWHWHRPDPELVMVRHKGRLLLTK